MIEQISGDDPGFVKRRPKPAVYQISIEKLFGAGIDKPTVEALLHILKVVGKTTGSMTLPETVAALEELLLMPLPAEPLPFPDDLTPVQQQILMMVDQIHAETRQNAEAIAALQSTINDLKQGIYP